MPRRLVVTTTALLAVAVVAGSAVFACTNLATLSLSSKTARPGERVVVVGTSFRVSRAPDQPTTPVVLHWGDGDGPILAEAKPEPTGMLSVTITVPDDAPAGYATIVATQRRPLAPPEETGNTGPAAYVDEVGTPARASIRILAPGEPREQVTFDPTSAIVPKPASSTTMLIVIVLVGAIALSLFGGGLIAYLHQHRTLARQPQPSHPQVSPPQ